MGPFSKKQQITIFFCFVETTTPRVKFFLRQCLPVKHFFISYVKSANCYRLSHKKSCSIDKHGNPCVKRKCKGITGIAFTRNFNEEKQSQYAYRPRKFAPSLLSCS